MTIKESILATLRGEPTDQLPYVPRLDIWYNANSEAGTLPPPYQNATLREITDNLGLGYHSIIPNFRDFRIEDGDIDVGLGIYDLNLTPYIINFHNIKRTHERLPGGVLNVKYETPKGDITTSVVFTEEMHASGATLYVIREHAIKTAKDFSAVSYILNNAEIIPNYSKYEKYQKEYVGDRGIAVALAAMYGSPNHYLVKELMSVQDYYYTMMDNPDEIDQFCDEIRPFFERLMKIATESPAEVILSGANYDVALTPPPVFEKYITPTLKRSSKMLHEKGKFLVTHTDGENKGLLKEYVDAKIDIADSVCPSPMTRVSFKEYRNAFDGHGITIWGGIPSTSVLKDSMSQRDFEAMIHDMLLHAGDGRYLILAIADTVPVAADFDRILHIAKKAREFGPVK